MFGSGNVGNTTSSLFGTPQKPTSLFGNATNTSSLFGTPKSTAATTGGLFGSVTTTTSAPSLFGTPAVSTAAGSLFGASNTPATSTTSTGLFGNKPVGGLFGGTSTGSSIFGSNPTTTAGGGLFKPFGSTTTTAPLFGGNASTGMSEDVKTLQSIIQNSQALTSAISDPKLFGDDRDGQIALFNQLLAAVGSGKAMYQKDRPPVEFDPQNPFYQFRNVGYCALSGHKNTDGIVGLIISESAENYGNAQQRQKLIDTLFTFMGSDPTLHAHFVDVRPTTEKICEVDIYVTKREVGRVTAKQLFQYFEQKDKKTAIEQQLKVLKVVPKVEMDETDIQKYLSRPPLGFTETEWKEAIILNPEPNRLLPYPVYGFKDLAERKHRQMIEAELQKKAFDALISRRKAVIQELSEIDGLRKIFVQDATRLRHRILRIIAFMHAQNTKNSLMTIEEETVRNRVDTISMCINAPDKLLDRLEAVKNFLKANKSKLEESKKEFNKSHGLTEDEASGLKRYLNRRQQDLESLTKTLKQNSEDVEIMLQHLR